MKRSSFLRTLFGGAAAVKVPWQEQGFSIPPQFVDVKNVSVVSCEQTAKEVVELLRKLSPNFGLLSSNEVHVIEDLQPYPAAFSGRHAGAELEPERANEP